MARSGPSRAFRKRDFHRRALTAHFVGWLAILSAAFVINRNYTPERFWLHWVALVALAALTVHGAVFARSTLATMGPSTSPRTGSSR
jgi:hypothetical protein